MSDFPSAIPVIQGPVLMTTDPFQGGGAQALGTNASSAAWQTNFLTIYAPIAVWEPCTAYQMSVEIGTQSGTLDVGIYTESGTRLVSAGSTSMGAAGLQVFNIADTALAVGMYFAALVVSTTAASLFRVSMGAAANGRVSGVQQETLASTVLPTTATFATLTAITLPVISIHTVATV